MNDIMALKREKNAMILAHHYQSESVKAVADFVGDSLEMARVAAMSTAPILVICGVYFMAETAKILSPDKAVLIPRIDAGCPMAEMVTAERLIEEKRKYPRAQVVCYVNSTAEVKAESDICCTSSNATAILNTLDADEIIFVPDQNLGHYASTQVPHKNIHLWKGFCPTHHRITREDVEAIKKMHPDGALLVHPECQPEIVEVADYVGSTSQIIKTAKNRQEQTLIIGTEVGVIETIRRDNPGKKVIPLHPHMMCPNMKKTTLEDVRHVLKTGENTVDVPEQIRLRALKAIKGMLDATS